MVFQEVAGLVAISMNVIGRHVVVTQNVAITTEATRVPAILVTMETDEAAATSTNAPTTVMNATMTPPVQTAMAATHVNAILDTMETDEAAATSTNVMNEVTNATVELIVTTL